MHILCDVSFLNKINVAPFLSRNQTASEFLDERRGELGVASLCVRASPPL